MNADRVNIFHAADGDCLVIRVTHNLKFDFFISLNALFDKYLVNRRELERVCADFDKLVFIVSKAAACTAECKCGTEYNGVTDSFGCLLCFVE